MGQKALFHEQMDFRAFFYSFIYPLLNKLSSFIDYNTALVPGDTLEDTMIILAFSELIPQQRR